MCGRVTLTIDFETLKDILRTRYKVNEPHINPYNPRYNIGPSQKLISVINDGENNRAGELSWGFVPPWSKDLKTGYSMINARAETIKEKPSFKASFLTKRCVLLADSYYEWCTTGGDKVPYRIQLKEQPLMNLAGLYTTCNLPDGQKHHSCTIITTDSNEFLKPIHHRMPCILADEQLAAWLNPREGNPELLAELLKPMEPRQMTLYEVSTFMNNVRNNTPECIAPKR